ncbi:MAG: hypothetical protein QNJ51_25795 [Calothrix sp. MO_167.B12]|nr:hypothetical protein [Calothrix sp. MO_167.B12]
MTYQQMTLFNLEPFQPSQSTYDPYWDEIPEESNQPVLMVVDDDEAPGDEDCPPTIKVGDRVFEASPFNLDNNSFGIVVSTDGQQAYVRWESSGASTPINIEYLELAQQPAPTHQPVLMVVDDDDPLPTTISKRCIGDGTGRITKRTISKNGKKYQQYWYDWQYYQDGRLVGRSKYIRKRLLPQIQALEQEKVPISKILEVLGA